MANPPRKNPMRTGAKLSLSKKSKEKENRENEKKKILLTDVDLNETSQFQEPMKSSMGRKARNVPVSAGSRSQSDNKTAMSSEGQKERQQEADVICQVCQKDITKINTQSRQQHVNRCMDKVEVERVAREREQEALESARTSVLNCPMCGKHFKTEPARLSHLKKCSQSLGVRTENMLKLVKDQEEERRVMGAAGVVPPTVSNARHKSSTSGNSRKRKAKEPKSQFEEDVQVAMAISSSLVQQEKGQYPDLIGQLPGRGSKGGGDKASRKNKKKTVLEDACLLTTLTVDDKQRRLEDRVNNILISEHADSPVNGPSELLTTDLHTSISDTQLWMRSLVAVEERDFYVQSLIPPLQVCNVAVGRKVRRMSSIPGRDTSFVAEKSNTPTMTSPDSTRLDDVMTASTQTAAVLAELAVWTHEDMDASQSNTVMDASQLSATSSPTDLHASGFCLEYFSLTADSHAQEERKLTVQFGSLVDSPVCSDVKIVTSDGKQIHGHRFILAARCPQLLQMVDRGQLNLPVTRESALPFLIYLYTGRLTVTALERTELLHLAATLEWDDLENLVNNLVTINDVADDNSKESGSKKGDIVKNDTDDLGESKLDLVLKDVWGESDSDLDPSDLDLAKDSSSNYDDKAGSEISKQEYYEIMCTQRRKFSETIDGDLNSGTGKTVGMKTSCEDDAEVDDEQDTADTECLLSVDNNVDISMVTNKPDVFSYDVSRETVVGNNSVKQSCPAAREHVQQSSTSNREFTIGNTDGDTPAPKKMKLDHSGHVTSHKQDGVNNGKFYHRTRKKILDTDSDGNVTDTAGHSINVVSDDLNLNHSETASAGTINLSDIDTHSETSENDNISNNLSDMSSNSSSICLSVKNDRSVSIHDTSNVDLFESPVFDANPSFKKISDTVVTAKKYLSEDFQLPTIPSDAEQSNDDTSNEKPDNEEKLRKFTFKSRRKGAEAGINQQTEEKNTSDNTTDIKQDYSADLANVDTDVKVEHYDDKVEELETIGSDSDVEITGDNFAEISQISPAFHSNKCKLSLVKQVSFGENEMSGEDYSNEAVDQDSTHFSNDDMNQSTTEYFNDSFSEIGNQNEVNKVKTTDSEEDELKSNDPLDGSASPVIGYKGPFAKNEKPFDEASNDSNTDGCELDYKGPFPRNELPSDEASKASNIDGHDLVSSQEVVELLSETEYGDVSVTEGPNESATGYVWDDFDDCGVGFPDVMSPPPTSQGEPIDWHSQGAEPMDSHCHGVEPRDSHSQGMVPTDSNLPITDNIMSPTTDTSMNLTPDNKMSPHSDTNKDPVSDKYSDDPDPDSDNKQLDDGDDSFLMKIDDDDGNIADQSVDSGQAAIAALSFKTPKVAESQKTKKHWVPPSPFTPMPKFEAMNTPGLKQAVQKYGIKPVGKKRMLLVLKDIFQQTHQYETDSDIDDDDLSMNRLATKEPVKPNMSATSRDGHEAVRPSKSEISRDRQVDRRKGKVAGKGKTRPTKSRLLDRLETGREMGEVNPVKAPIEDIPRRQTKRPFKRPEDHTSGKSTIPSLSADDDCIITSSQGESSSQDSDISELLGESCLHAPSDDSDVSTSPQKQGDVTRKLMAYIRKNLELHTRILLYEPLELDVLKHEIKAAGIKCSGARLLEFLDEQCIAFTTKNARKGKPARGRRARTAKASSKSRT